MKYIIPKGTTVLLRENLALPGESLRHILKTSAKFVTERKMTLSSDDVHGYVGVYDVHGGGVYIEFKLPNNDRDIQQVMVKKAYCVKK